MFDSVFNLSKYLSVINRDDGKRFTITDRLDAIKRKLSSTDYKTVYEYGLFSLYSKKPLSQINDPLVVISTHIDCEKGITQCFSKEYNEECIIGTYDNSITNTAILYHMLHSDMPDNVVIAFTGDEEVSCKGAAELSSFLNPYDVSVIIVLDVTYCGWETKAEFTVENNFWNDRIKNTVIEEIKNCDNRWKFVPSSLDEIPSELSPENVIYEEAMEDESWTYDEMDLNCFSFCIPVEGEMHSDRGVQIRKRSLSVYTQTLLNLILALSK